jgi:hypothetical protein
MRRHQGGETFARCGIETDRRLIEQPERAGDEGKARQSEPPALTGGEHRRLKIGDGLEAEAREGAVKIAAFEEVAPEAQILGDRQMELQGIAIADEMAVLGR